MSDFQINTSVFKQIILHIINLRIKIAKNTRPKAQVALVPCIIQ